jgi:hypothetical protein
MTALALLITPVLAVSPDSPGLSPSPSRPSWKITPVVAFHLG